MPLLTVRDIESSQRAQILEQRIYQSSGSRQRADSRVHPLRSNASLLLFHLRNIRCIPVRFRPRLLGGRCGDGRRFRSRQVVVWQGTGSLALVPWRVRNGVVKAATHHLSSTSHTSLDPDEGFLIPQTFFPRIPALSTGGEAIIADDASATAGVAAFGHDF